MQANAWMEPGKGSIGVKAGGGPQDSDRNIDDTENPSLISRGGILAGRGGQPMGGIG